MILGSVPLFNIFAVIILTVESPQQHGKVTPSKLLYGVLTNPILDGIILGTLYSLLPFGLPTLAQKTLTSLSSLTTPLALLSIGASFEGAKAIKKLHPPWMAGLLQADGADHDLYPHCRQARFPGPAADCPAHHAGQPHHAKLLRYGQEHGP